MSVADDAAAERDERRTVALEQIAESFERIAIALGESPSGFTVAESAASIASALGKSFSGASVADALDELSRTLHAFTSSASRRKDEDDD